jgi:glycosyltransferase involved in cell wall biosynthesis
MSYNSRVRPSRQRIALNAQLLQMSAGYRSAGIARYIFHLLRALPSAAQDFELHAYTRETHARDSLDSIHLHLTRLQTQTPTTRILWEQLAFPLFLARTHFDLCHSMAYVSPLINATPCVVTVYDLSFVLYPEYFRFLNRAYLTWGTRLSTSRARRVIAISESTKRDLVRLFNLPPDKIDVVPPGVEYTFFPNGDGNAVERFRRAKNLPEHFILFVGTREPRKNIPTLIRAFANAKSRLHFPHQLVIVGGQGWKDQALSRVIKESDMQHDVILLGFAPSDELPFLYRSAEAFVYPSQYEGFGMPLLEAMASGTPVITGNLSSLPEAVGGAALLVDPRDEAALEQAIIRLISDRSLREELIAEGHDRARQFTWARAAQATADVYRRALREE